MNTPFHLVYKPGDTIRGTKDTILGLVQTNDPADLQVLGNVGEDAIVMMLEAHDRFEADAEIRDLGFSL